MPNKHKFSDNDSSNSDKADCDTSTYDTTVKDAVDFVNKFTKENKKNNKCSQNAKPNKNKCPNANQNDFNDCNNNKVISGRTEQAKKIGKMQSLLQVLSKNNISANDVLLLSQIINQCSVNNDLKGTINSFTCGSEFMKCEKGDKGDQGIQGPPGLQGPPGKWVVMAAMDCPELQGLQDNQDNQGQ